LFGAREGHRLSPWAFSRRLSPQRVNERDREKLDLKLFFINWTEKVKDKKAEGEKKMWI
jgi:hypothetical protein